MWFYTLLLVFCVCSVESLNLFGKRKSLFHLGDAGDPLILTPLIKSGDTDKARSKARVRLADYLGVKSYSGYFTVNETHNSNLFFWFFPSARDPKQDPVVLWLQGGPGSSSLIGLFVENGPLDVTKQKILKKRRYTWQINHSVLYIDSPVGTGFSFTDSDDGYVTDQVQVGEHLYEALLQFFQLFPEYRENQFFITGESYGGKYVPAIGYTIHNKNPDADQKINLQGLAIGNGLTDPIRQFSSYSIYLYQIGLIDNNTAVLMEDADNTIADNIENEQWRDAAIYWNKVLNYFQLVSNFSNVYNYLYPVDDTDLDSYSTYLNRTLVRSAIHVGNVPYHVNNDEVYMHLLEDIPKSVAPWLSELLNYYRVLIYAGQLDIICNYSGIIYYLQNLDFSAADEYVTAKRKIWEYENEIAGYVKTAGNLTEVLVRNAGHLVPKDQPKWAFNLITMFTSNKL